MKVGDLVIYHDEKGVPHNALLTAVWGAYVDANNNVIDDGTGAVNLVFVSGDESDHDNYGRQIKRESSVTHVSKTAVHGRYWRQVLEEARPYIAPVSA